MCVCVLQLLSTNSSSRGAWPSLTNVSQTMPNEAERVRGISVPDQHSTSVYVGLSRSGLTWNRDRDDRGRGSMSVCVCVCVCGWVWVCGCVGVWVCGCVGVWVCTCIYVYIYV